MAHAYPLLKKLFGNPLTNGLDINTREAVEIHKRIIKENFLLREYYAFVYRYFSKVENSLSGLGLPSLEIGSGGGFIKEYIPGIITSDVVLSEGIDRAEDAACLSFPAGSLKAVFANNVMHHLGDVIRFVEEVQRVLVRGGVFVCNEPSLTLFGYFMLKNFHHEYTDKYVRIWEGTGFSKRLTDANTAIPYILFKKEAGEFQRRFTQLKIRSIVYHDFIRYMLSGGLSYRPFVSQPLYGTVELIESLLRPFMPLLGNSMLVTLQKI